MAWINEKKNSALFKVVYYGPSRQALEDNLVRIGEKVGATASDEKPKDPQLVYHSTLEFSLGVVRGRNISMLLQTAPPDAHPAGRILSLKGVDGVVFVVSRENSANNGRYLEELRDHLKSLGYPEDTPLVIQRGMEEGNDLDTDDLPSITANFASGEGVMETLEAISKLVLNEFHKNTKT